MSYKWILVVAVLAVHGTGRSVQAAVDEPPSTPPVLAGEINVNPYGDPIWQVEPDREKPHHAVRHHRSKARHSVKRHRSKSQHAKRVRPDGHGRATVSKPRHSKPVPIARPPNSVPAAKAR